MSAGIPLTDDDRWPWLDAIAAWMKKNALRGEPGIVTCSALKRSYRERLRGPNVIFVFLNGTREVIEARLTSRSHHFMPPALLDSQLAALEPPTPDENVLEVNLAGTRLRKRQRCCTPWRAGSAHSPDRLGEVSNTPERVQIPTGADFARASLTRARRRPERTAGATSSANR